MEFSGLQCNSKHTLIQPALLCQMSTASASSSLVCDGAWSSASPGTNTQRRGVDEDTPGTDDARRQGMRGR